MEDKMFQVVLLASLAHCDPKLQWEGLLARVQGQATHFRIFKPQKIWTHSSLSSLDPRTTTQPIAAVTAHHCWLRSILYLPSKQFQLLPPLPSSPNPPRPQNPPSLSTRCQSIVRRVTRTKTNGNVWTPSPAPPNYHNDIHNGFCQRSEPSRCGRLQGSQEEEGQQVGQHRVVWSRVCDPREGCVRCRRQPG